MVQTNLANNTAWDRDFLLNNRFYARAPMRISLAGGGTDVGTYPDEFGGSVISCAITIFAQVSLSFRADGHILIQEGSHIDEFESIEAYRASGKHEVVGAVLKRMGCYNLGVEVRIYSGTQPRSGLGGSAALFVALLSMFNHINKENRLDNYSLADLAWELERDELGNLGGRQDQYASVFGGLNYIEFLKNSFVRVMPFNIEPRIWYHLENSLVLFWIGDRARSGGVIEDQIARIEGKNNIEALHEAKLITERMKRALINGNMLEVGRLLEAGWQAKKGFSPMVTSPAIDKFHDGLMEAGMVGGRVTGAGGGGHFLAYVEIQDRQKVIDAAVEMGAKYVQIGLEDEGVVTWHLPRNGHLT